MPFKSHAQRRFMFATMPARAKEWAAETPKGGTLPNKVTSSDPRKTRQQNVSKNMDNHKGGSKTLKVAGVVITLAPGQDKQAAPLRPINLGPRKPRTPLREQAIRRITERFDSPKKPAQSNKTPDPVKEIMAHEDLRKLGEERVQTRKKMAEVLVGQGVGTKQAVYSVVQSIFVADTQSAPRGETGPSCKSKVAMALAGTNMPTAIQPQQPPQQMNTANQVLSQFLQPKQQLPGQPVAGAGLRPTGVGAVDPSAATVPGMAGTAASNPIAKHGPITGGIVDGNHAAGVEKGVKLGGLASTALRSAGSAAGIALNRIAPETAKNVAIGGGSALAASALTAWAMSRKNKKEEDKPKTTKKAADPSVYGGGFSNTGPGAAVSMPGFEIPGPSQEQRKQWAAQGRENIIRKFHNAPSNLPSSAPSLNTMQPKIDLANPAPLLADAAPAVPQPTPQPIQMPAQPKLASWLAVPV